MSIIGGSASYITSTITKRKGMVVISYDTGSGLIQWHLYTWDDVGLTWVELTNPPHTHEDSTSGGKLFDILNAAKNTGLIFFSDTMPIINNWLTFASGTGAAVADDTTERAIKMSTGTTTGGYAFIQRRGISITGDLKLSWNGKWKISHITNVLFRFGIRVEDPNASSDNNNKIGLEWCDSQATSNYYTLSANGSSRSLVDSGVALAANADHGARIIYFPASKAQYTFWNGTVYDKTGVLPAGAITGEPNLRWGLKNNNGGSANRDLWMHGTALRAEESDGAWVDSD